MPTQLYEVLGVKVNATATEIKAGYRKRAQSNHPDRPGGSQEGFETIAHAYEILSDPDRRARYDATGDETPPADEHAIDMQTLAQVALQVLDGTDQVEHYNVIGGMKAMFLKARETFEHNVKVSQARIDKCIAATARLSHKEGTSNMLIDILTGSTAQQRRIIEANEFELAKIARLLKLLEEYDYRCDLVTHTWASYGQGLGSQQPGLGRPFP